ncbi:MAG: cytochrome b/b6 domain-containing protein [Gammaproteobacteria bacterium]|nr:MAG: cytochrome b/b6 domain-containing protein [Gammaproteobacteria bacterium]
MVRESSNHDNQITVWDLPTRVFHWALALSLAGSWITHELGLAWMEWHMRLGYLALTLVIFRLAWGLVGPRYARFSQFLAAPGPTLRYLFLWLKGAPPAAAGHSPIGGWAVIAMLVAVAVQAVSGLFNSDEILYSGPWHAAAPSVLTDRMEALHAGNFNVLLTLTALHLAVMAKYWIRWRRNLIGPMLTGSMPEALAGGDKAISSQRVILAVILLAASAASVWLIVAAAPAPDPEDFF